MRSRNDTRRRRTRRRLLGMLGVWGGIGVAGCLGGDTDDEEDDFSDDDGEDDNGSENGDGDGDDDGEPEAPAHFEVTALSEAGIEIDEDETFSITANIENTGDLEDTQEVELRIEGDVIGSVEVTLSGGENNDRQFTDVETELDAGEYEFGVYTADSQMTGSLTIEKVEETEAGLLHHWPMDEGEAGTVADVVSGHDGTLAGVTWLEGDYVGGYALENQDEDEVELTDFGEFGDNLDQDFAIAYTIESEDDHHSSCVLSAREDGDGIAVWYNIHPNFGDAQQTVRVYARNGANTNAIQAENELLLGGPHRVVINKLSNDAHNWEIYVNGEAVAADVRSNALEQMPPIPDNVRLFVDAHTDVNHFVGVLDNLKIWTGGLGEDEISADYDAQPWS